MLFIFVNDSLYLNDFNCNFIKLVLIIHREQEHFKQRS